MTSSDSGAASERTASAARAAVLESLERVISASDDDLGPRVVTPETAAQALEIAWRHQFDNDRSDSRRAIRQLISDRVSEVLMEETE